MNCNDARQLLEICADGEIGAGDGVRLEHHLEDCSDCVDALAALRGLRKLVREGTTYFESGTVEALR
ncbi:anti-sigma factor family protein [Cupriavidus pampae]|uniref:Putative zinc-finger domain-containing protein n=1 Tax=Cupriavidus pampae TaxID=659251 RepID=A0ABN7Z5F0_9BURK|nr:zf-HC2 domain-containing protein [Cupriavidus pampae]CAG9179262.1 hypothetical protein LMG32289_04312 [Cupriavidus pampae]